MPGKVHDSHMQPWAESSPCTDDGSVLDGIQPLLTMVFLYRVSQDCEIYRTFFLSLITNTEICLRTESINEYMTINLEIKNLWKKKGSK